MKIDLFWDSEEDSTKFTVLNEVPAMYGQQLVFIPKGFVSDRMLCASSVCGGIVMQ